MKSSDLFLVISAAYVAPHMPLSVGVVFGLAAGVLAILAYRDGQ